MKANEFVKKHGLAEVKILLTSPSHGFFFKEDFYKHYGFDIYEDLKRLVESHELVEKYKRGRGIRFRVRWGMYRYGDTQEFNDRLKQAIFDVESCQ